MAIILGGVTLPDLVKDQEYGWTGIRAEIDRSTGGAPIVWEQEITGRPVDLVGGDDWGLITRSTLESLKALASVLRATYTLSYEGEEYTARFRHEEGAIEATPVLPRPNQASGDYYRNVRIRLMITG